MSDRHHDVRMSGIHAAMHGKGRDEGRFSLGLNPDHLDGLGDMARETLYRHMHLGLDRALAVVYAEGMLLGAQGAIKQYSLLQEL